MRSNTGVSPVCSSSNVYVSLTWEGVSVAVTTATIADGAVALIEEGILVCTRID
jgi:hypothetical protein